MHQNIKVYRIIRWIIIMAVLSAGLFLRLNKDLLRSGWLILPIR